MHLAEAEHDHVKWDCFVKLVKDHRYGQTALTNVNQADARDVLPSEEPWLYHPSDIFLVSVFTSLICVFYGYDFGVIAEHVISSNFVALSSPTSSRIGAFLCVCMGRPSFGSFFAGLVWE